MTYKLICGNALKILSKGKENSFQCCITSPPYFGLRDYKTAEWEGGDSSCEHSISHYSDSLKPNVDRPFRGDRTVCLKCGALRVDDQIGLENTPEEYINNLVCVFREVKRVLKDDGTLWIVIGDSYNGSGGPGGWVDNKQTDAFKGEFKKYNNPNRDVIGLKPKDLIGIPWMLAFALRSDGWWLRSDIIWAKNNPMPESVRDRPTKAHEYIFLLSKSRQYYYDHESIKEPTVTKDTSLRNRDSTRLNNTPGRTRMGGLVSNNYDTRNRRSVWTVNTRGYKGAHFAVYPPDLIEPCIMAGSKKKDWILDPFCGSGTTGVVALKHDRRFIGIDLNSNYLELAKERIEKENDTQ